MTSRTAPKPDPRPQEEAARLQSAPAAPTQGPEERKPAKPEVTNIRIGFSDWASI